jgi:hypothetical protein
MAMRPAGGELLRRRKLGKALDNVSGKPLFTESVISWPVPPENEGRLGRRSALTNAELLQRRDQLHGIFAAHWPTIGWNLQRARGLTQIGPALRLLANLRHPTIELLLSNTSGKALPDGAHPFQQERKRLYKELVEVENGLSAANTKVMEAEGAFEQAQNRFAIARDGYSWARKKRKKKKAKSFLEERKKWSSLCQRVQAELNQRKEGLKDCYVELSEIRTKITDTEAHFTQTELLQFLLSERYAFTPLNLANAAAGLPQMSWRNSFRLCLRGACSPETSINYRIVEAMNLILERTNPTSAEEAASEIRDQISRRKRFERVLEYVSEHWPELEDAVRKVWNSPAQPKSRAFQITALFLEVLKAPRREVNPLLDALEKDLSTT